MLCMFTCKNPINWYASPYAKKEYETYIFVCAWCTPQFPLNACKRSEEFMNIPLGSWELFLIESATKNCVWCTHFTCQCAHRTSAEPVWDIGTCYRHRRILHQPQQQAHIFACHGLKKFLLVSHEEKMISTWWPIMLVSLLLPER